jgi:hypothetical protein
VVRNRYKTLYLKPSGDGVNAAAPWYEWNFRRRRGLEAVRAVINAKGGYGPGGACG